ncbi:MAG TPA: hypothetical protein VNJ02_20165 [Vicinamibacterales bacterium]|nr:hypothetical protein [Vicinamibacterales bacterium]
MRIWNRRNAGCIVVIAALTTPAFFAPAFFAQGYKSNLPSDHVAIQYADRRVHDAVAALAEQVERGALTFTPGRDARGYLPDVLKHLRVNPDSQMLVFSKTSFQAAHISPSTPRAIYFNDSVAVAYAPGAPLLELAALDPVQGPIFYAMTANAEGRPSISRRSVCLSCHQGPNTAGVPGLYVGSVIPGPSGAPLRNHSAIITDHRSPFEDRWGGWYVTARRGQPADRANAVASNPADPGTLVREAPPNLTSLARFVEPSGYLGTTSDIVALMTFEHQTQMINLMTRVAWQARLAEHAGHQAGLATPAVNADVDELVSYMLFEGEAPLAEPIDGGSTFAETFAQRGPRDARGRSLRDFDLRTRLFRYPVSYMIYSPTFDALPSAVRDRIYQRLHDALSGADRRPPSSHLLRQQRRAALEILKETKPTLPAYWGGGN